jgi:hypothetical protein
MKATRTTSRASQGILIALLLLLPLGAPAARAHGNRSHPPVATGEEPLLSLVQFLEGQLLSLRDWRRLTRIPPVEAASACPARSACRGSGHRPALSTGPGETPDEGSIATVEVAPR